jgi:hypothetical protein
MGKIKELLPEDIDLPADVDSYEPDWGEDYAGRV